MRELKPTTEESIRHFETQQKRYVREHNGKLCPHYANAIIALRRAQPENSRQHALQTGVCPMCEDCPDGCPILTPNDSRNTQEKEPKWISVKDRLPKESLNVLIYIPFRGAHLHYVSYMESGLWYVPTMYGRSSLDDVTHWMPLPDPPTSMTIQN